MSKKMILFIAALATLGAVAYAAYNVFNQLKDIDYEFDLQEDIEDESQCSEKCGGRKTMTKFRNVEDDFNRYKDLMLAIDKAFNENEDLLENLASDYDEGFVCYSEDEPS